MPCATLNPGVLHPCEPRRPAGQQVAKVCKENGAAEVEQIIADLTLRDDTNKVAEVGARLLH